MEVSARTITGADDGFTLWYVGLLRKLDGNRPRAALMAACTSRAALLMSRSRSNIKEMRVEPSVLRELISLRPAIDPSDCSRGVATLDPLVSGLAPPTLADTDIMAQSTCGQRPTGKKKK